jgi:hypothetical protein
MSMTETELMREAATLAEASKRELAEKHRAKFITEWMEVRGRFDPPRHKMLGDLITDLAIRFKGEGKA